MMLISLDTKLFTISDSNIEIILINLSVILNKFMNNIYTCFKF